MALTSPEALRGFLVSAFAGLFLALIGALGSGDAPLPVRLVYWIGLCVAGSVVGTGVSQVIGRDGRADARPWLYGSLIAIGVT
ncbi:MAG: hypothetical protein B7Z44_04940, partial [Caulobacter sp. 12-67-6]